MRVIDISRIGFSRDIAVAVKKVSIIKNTVDLLTSIQFFFIKDDLTHKKLQHYPKK